MHGVVIDWINELAYNYQKLGLGDTDELELIVSSDIFNKLMCELENNMCNKVEGKINAVSRYGVNVTVSCKEINNSILSRKLNECFKILSK